MKKINIYKTVFVLFIISIILLNLTLFGMHKQTIACYDIKPETYQDNDYVEDDAISYNTFMEAYFRGLRYNMGENYKGSCGYVALGMLLSYYDTFLCDAIIPEIYDVPSIDSGNNTLVRHNSPGILNEDIKDAKSLSASEYYEIMEDFANNEAAPSLHAKLITIANKFGYYNFNDSLNPCSTYYSYIINVLNYYLINIANFNENSDYKIISETGSSSAVQKFVKSKIDEGYPVLVAAYNAGESGGHAFVAYDYSGENIYCNMGWSGGFEHSRVGLWYDTYNFAIAIDFKMEHTHTNNYGVINADGSVDYYCWDSCGIITFKEQEHKNFRGYEYVSEQEHASHCECGARIVESHTYTDHYDNNELLEHTAYCVCGASKVDVHNYTNFYVKFGSEQYHYAYCVCGNKTEDKHIWVREADSSGKVTYKRCKKCLYLVKLRDDEGIQVPIVRREDEYETS